MKVLVLGAGGMAGHIISLFLREQGYEVDPLSARTKLDESTVLLDVLDADKLNSFLKNDKWDVVINCIALLVQQSEERKDLAVYLNSYFPHFLEDFFKDSSTRIIHISTDGVFSGKKPPYKEDSQYSAEDFYGRSKALGELINDKDLTIRTSIIGPDLQRDGPGLFNQLMMKKGEVNAYTTYVWCGISTLELAKGIDAAIKENIAGVYHLVSGTSINRYDLLKLIKNEFALKNITIKASSGPEINRTLLNTRQDLRFRISDYAHIIKDMRGWIERHPNLYEHYEI